MKVIEGNYQGKSGRVVADFLKGEIMQIAGNTFKVPGDFDVIKLTNKDESKPSPILMLILALTLIGIPIAILYAISAKKVTANVAFNLKNGRKILASCDSADWKVVSKYCGKGELGSALDSI